MMPAANENEVDFGGLALPLMSMARARRWAWRDIE